MEPAKVFNNVIIGQFVLTGVPVKVYVGGRYLIITEADDVEDSTYGFGMDEDGDMQQFDYFAVEHLMVSGNVIELDLYNKGMGATEEEPKEEEPKEEPKEESAMPSVQEISKDVLKAKLDVIKKQEKELKDKEASLKKEPIEEGQTYTFGTGDIVKNVNPTCKHHGSIGIVKKLMTLPNEMGTVAIYTVMNSGATYRPGDSLTKTIDQLEPITAIDSSEEE